MLTSCLRIAWRKITGHKLYSIIHIIGLTLGISACLIIYLITSYDLSFDSFLPDKDRIFRIVGKIQDKQGNQRFLNSPVLEVADFQYTIPGFEAKTSFFPFGGSITIPWADGKKFKGTVEGNGAATSILTGSDYFAVFPYQWLVGNAHVLDTPFRVVLTESAARKYFGQGPLDKVIGQKLIFKDSLPVWVGGIVKDWDKNSDFKYDQFISLRTAPLSFLKSSIPTDDWTSLRPGQSQAFVKLARGVTPAQVDAAFASFIRGHVRQVAFFPTDSKLKMYLQPLTGIHFTTDYYREDDGDHIDKPYLPILYALIGLAGFILVLAAINFINLSTAQANERAKEVGVRKVMGSGRGRLVLQFLLETLVLTLMAVLLSLLVVGPLLAAFRSFIPRGVRFHFADPGTLLFLLLITLLTTLLAGYYPARVLSSYSPVLSLKGPAFRQGSTRGSLRKVMIVFQFSLSIAFIIGGTVIGNQIHFMHHIDKGFISDNIITITNEEASAGQLRRFSEDVRGRTDLWVSRQSHNPMSFDDRSGYFTYRGKDLVEQKALILAADRSFIPLYNMKVLAGGGLPLSDSIKDLVINETFCRMLGFTSPGKALDEMIYFEDKRYLIKGVVADFVEKSYHETIKPLVLLHRSQDEKIVVVRLPSKNEGVTDTRPILAEIEQEWKKSFPETPFQYNYLNDSLESMYGQENRTATLINMAMIITIFISCLGIFGLGMFTTERRAKEIGVRKVFGASVVSITALLTKDLVFLVLIALMIASPLSWYLMNRWLMDFTYRISISAWVFVIAGSSAMLIALMTVSFQAIRAASANPVKVLRSE
jgi:putative ABC transport system permease protein